MVSQARVSGRGTESIRQRFLLDLDASSENRNGNGKKKKPRSQKVPNKAIDEIASLAVAEILETEIRILHERLTSIELMLVAIHDKLEKSAPAKEYYTTLEVAKILSRRPYTVREWCRLGRVRGEKTFSGRGQDEEWRISHVELLRIQNEGLLPQARNNRVPLPGRLEKRDAKTE